MVNIRRIFSTCLQTSFSSRFRNLASAKRMERETLREYGIIASSHLQCECDSTSIARTKLLNRNPLGVYSPRTQSVTSHATWNFFCYRIDFHHLLLFSPYITHRAQNRYLSKRLDGKCRSSPSSWRGADNDFLNIELSFGDFPLTTTAVLSLRHFYYVVWHFHWRKKNNRKLKINLIGRFCQFSLWPVLAEAHLFLLFSLKVKSAMNMQYLKWSCILQTIRLGRTRTHTHGAMLCWT